VQEQSSLNPGISILDPLENVISHFPVGGNIVSAQSISTGLGLSGSASASRVETIAYTYSFPDLVAEGWHDCAYFQKGVLIQSDLKIAQFIYDKAVAAGAGNPSTEYPGYPPYTTFQDEITFVASYGGSVTPTWKFAKVAVNPTSTLFSATRTKTNDLIITIGQVIPATDTSPAQLTAAAASLHYAAVIGSATAQSVNSTAHPPTQ